MDRAIERSENFLTRVDPGATTRLADARVVPVTAPASAAAEQYRVLYHRLEHLRARRPLRCVAITSAVAGEGKTLTAVNLALTAARANPLRSVLLVDADLRRPRAHGYLGIAGSPGLAEVLAGEAALEEAVRSFTSVRMAVLTAGPPPDDATAALHAPPMRRLLEELAGRFDEIYLDAPPCLPFADAQVIAGQCQGVVMVVRAGATPARYLSRAVEQLKGAPLIGCVLNGVDAAELAYGEPRH